MKIIIIINHNHYCPHKQQINEKSHQLKILKKRKIFKNSSNNKTTTTIDSDDDNNDKNEENIHRYVLLGMSW